MRKTARQQQLDNLRRQHSGDPFFDSWERDFDKSFKRTRSGIAAVWLGVLVANLVIWAIVQLVQWVTAQ